MYTPDALKWAPLELEAFASNRACWSPIELRTSPCVFGCYAFNEEIARPMDLSGLMTWADRVQPLSSERWQAK